MKTFMLLAVLIAFVASTQGKNQAAKNTEHFPMSINDFSHELWIL